VVTELASLAPLQPKGSRRCTCKKRIRANFFQVREAGIKSMQANCATAKNEIIYQDRSGQFLRNCCLAKVDELLNRRDYLLGCAYVCVHLVILSLSRQTVVTQYLNKEYACVHIALMFKLAVDSWTKCCVLSF
jgi:hypothetical protein